MSSINKTPHYNLSQFGDSPDDKPSWRGDYTGDMSKIDSQMYRNETDATTATSIANTAKTTADNALSFANTAKTTADNALSLAKTNESNIGEQESYFNALGVTSQQTAQSLMSNINGKANTSDVYTKTQVDNTFATIVQLNQKANSSDVYTTSAADSKFALKTEVPETVTSNIIVTMGDSYADGLGANKWPNKLIDMLPGWTLKNYAVSGAGWNVSGRLFHDQLNAAIADTTLDKTRVGIVLVAGGRNDIMDASIAKTRTIAFVTLARASFPNARIMVVPMLWHDTALNGAGRVKAAGVLAGAAEAGAEGINWAWTWNMGNTSNFPGGDVHPNENGAQVIASYMASAIRGSYSGRTEAWYQNNGGANCASLSIVASGGFITYSWILKDSATAEQRTFQNLPSWAVYDGSPQYGGACPWALYTSNSGTGVSYVILGNANSSGTTFNQKLLGSLQGTAGGQSAGNCTIPW
jgi:hypothetical protein